MKTSEMTFKIKDFNPTTKVLATGLVLGNLWGGGEGVYASRPINGASIKEVLDQVNAGIKTGSLDSGMGFDGLIGAKITLHVITRITIEDSEFENIEYDTVFVGDLSEDQEIFLDQCDN